jgi:hypothetical protein
VLCRVQRWSCSLLLMSAARSLTAIMTDSIKLHGLNEDLALFLVQMLIILALIRVLTKLVSYLQQPPVIGEIIAGLPSHCCSANSGRMCAYRDLAWSFGAGPDQRLHGDAFPTAVGPHHRHVCPDRYNRLTMLLTRVLNRCFASM